MIDTKAFYETLINNDFDYFAGVPDSLLKEFCLCVNTLSKENHIITANEGNAVALASGYNIATSKYGVVYMQNSGLGNAVNPLLSLSDEKVYKIPMLLIIGYRGEPGTKDEPQHIKQGELTLPLLDTLGIKYMMLCENYIQQIKYCRDYVAETSRPIALVARKDSFSKFEEGRNRANTNALSREEALAAIIESLNDNDFIVSTTGKTSREIFEIREKNNEGHANDYLTVGSMGHTSSLALGISRSTDKNIYCIDGDGAFIMHMGGLAVAVQNAPDNFKYILINNGCHESVGGQPTIAYDIDIPKILSGFGFKKVLVADCKEAIVSALKEQQEAGKVAIVINVNSDSRKDLGRPTTTPIYNKEQFMKKIASTYESTNI